QVYAPTTYEIYHVDVIMNEREISIDLYDTSGQEEYDRIRPLGYPDTDVALIAYAIDSPYSLSNITYKLPEIRHFVPEVSVILVGCKKDLRTDEKTIKELASTGESAVTYDEGLAFAREIGATAFVECSSLTDEGIWHALHVVSWLAVYAKR
ncbi:hypothetical protein BOTBODRAFT_78455, partial [Botryobasidium botryosum FD-172 SS1]